MKIHVFLERKVTLVSINMCLVQSCVACSLAKATWSNSLQVVFKLRVPTLWTITLSMTTGARGHRIFLSVFHCFWSKATVQWSNHQRSASQLIFCEEALIESFSATLWNFKKPFKNHQTTKRCLFSGCNKPQRLVHASKLGLSKPTTRTWGFGIWW